MADGRRGRTGVRGATASRGAGASGERRAGEISPMRRETSIPLECTATRTGPTEGPAGLERAQSSSGRRISWSLKGARPTASSARGCTAPAASSPRAHSGGCPQPLCPRCAHSPHAAARPPSRARLLSASPVGLGGPTGGSARRLQSAPQSGDRGRGRGGGSAGAVGGRRAATGAAEGGARGRPRREGEEAQLAAEKGAADGTRRTRLHSQSANATGGEAGAQPGRWASTGNGRRREQRKMTDTEGGGAQLDVAGGAADGTRRTRLQSQSATEARKRPRSGSGSANSACLRPKEKGGRGGV